jgi:hypothetical protein
MGMRAAIVFGALTATLCVSVGAQTRPEILRISPTSGPEGSRVEIIGKNLQGASAVLFGSTSSAFTFVSPEELVALIPHKSETSTITVVTPRGRASSPFAFVISNDPRVPDEVSYKAGYVNAEPRPRNFKSALLWGIAIADTRVPGYESAAVEIASTQLTCRIDGRDVILNDDKASVRGGLYRRVPWFGTDQHDPMPIGQKNVWDRVSDPVLPRCGRGRKADPISIQGNCTSKLYTFCKVASVAARNNFCALLFGSPLPNTALPATRISAPARTTSPTVSRATPPSTSIR